MLTDKQREYKRRYYVRWPERVKESAKRTKERDPERWAEWQRKYRRNHFEMCLLRAAKQRAKSRNLEFNMDIADIVLPTHCPVLGIPLRSYAGTSRKHMGGQIDSYSIDRIDNAKGYIKGNVQIISHLANMMKSKATPEQLKKFAEWVNKTYA